MGLFYFLGMACLNLPIQSLVNPNPEGYSMLSQFRGVLFTPKNFFAILAEIHLQRPIRLLNRMLFWTIVGFVKNRSEFLYVEFVEQH